MSVIKCANYSYIIAAPYENMVCAESHP